MCPKPTCIVTLSPALAADCALKLIVCGADNWKSLDDAAPTLCLTPLTKTDTGNGFACAPSSKTFGAVNAV